MLPDSGVHGAQHTPNDNTEDAYHKNDGDEPSDGHGHATTCLGLLLRGVPGPPPGESRSGDRERRKQSVNAERQLV